jgi:hypothetical protein
VARFEPDKRKFIPDHGAQCILEEYISRWKLRIKQTRKHEEDPQSSSDAEHVVAESSSKQIHSPMANVAANTTEQQVPAPNVLTEPAAPENIPVASNESPIQTPSVSGTVVQPSSASEQTVEPDVWTIADALWDSVRQAKAEASRQHNKLFGESSIRSIVEYCNLGSLRDRRRAQRTLVRSERSSLIDGVRRSSGQRRRL